jgi:hypothetical protein
VAVDDRLLRVPPVIWLIVRIGSAVTGPLSLQHRRHVELGVGATSGLRRYATLRGPVLGVSVVLMARRVPDGSRVGYQLTPIRERVVTTLVEVLRPRGAEVRNASYLLGDPLLERGPLSPSPSPSRFEDSVPSV